MAHDADLLRRAFAAWFRTGGMDHPGHDSAVNELNGHTHAVLHNRNGTLAAYRVRKDGMLKRLKRSPWSHYTPSPVNGQ